MHLLPEPTGRYKRVISHAPTISGRGGGGQDRVSGCHLTAEYDYEGGGGGGGGGGAVHFQPTQPVGGGGGTLTFIRRGGGTIQSRRGRSQRGSVMPRPPQGRPWVRKSNVP